MLVALTSRFVFGALLVSLSLAQLAIGQSESSLPPGWQAFENCPVRAERVVDVPALESGLLASVEVDQNQAVQEDAVLAQLDEEIAQLSQRLAQYELLSADALATDNSDIDFHQFAMEQREEEYRNYEKIATRFSDSELRQKKLAWEQAKVALVRAKHAQQRAAVDAQLKAASLEAAKISLKRRSVTAPLSGVVSKRYKHAGQWVEAGEPILQITDLSQLVIDRSIPIDAFKLHDLLGAEVRVQFVDNRSRESVVVQGEVASYDHEVSAKGLSRIHIRVQNRQVDGSWLLLPGMNVKVFLKSGQDIDFEETSARGSEQTVSTRATITRSQIN
ncbi:MAG: HlyD family efflux transporter periplasmic adaptor subunit [Planctomycetota bacterium]